ncbi:hypothetical protein V2O64_24325 (plasmid) [Verrucomicrobiaceae bacterium 227]
MACLSARAFTRKRLPNRSLGLTGFLLIGASSSMILAEEQRSLFDGKSLEGWVSTEGIIAPQIHKGGHVTVQFKEVSIRELPSTPDSPTWKSLDGVEAALAKATPKKPRQKMPAKPAAAPFGNQKSASGVKHSFLIAGNPTVLVGEDGQVKWKIAGKARDGYVLENGNVLLSIGNIAKEITRKNKAIWSYKLPAKNKELGTVVRLKNGNTIICSYGQGDPQKVKIFEITPDKKVVWEFFHPKARAHGIHIVTTNGRREGTLK